MISPEADIGLDELNELTQAWVESDYNRREHSELGTSPLARSFSSPSVVRPSPTADALRAAFRLVATRRQRRSDGTILVEGQRFEIPSRFRHVRDLHVRYARWDLSNVDLWDPVARVVLGRILPLDKAANADGLRRKRGAIASPAASTAEAQSQATEPTSNASPNAPSWRVAPYLHELLTEMRGSGLPPAFIPMPEPQERDAVSDEPRIDDAGGDAS
jgi:putative transposase